MSDEEGEIQEVLNASRGEESTTSDESPWQMQDLHDIISLQMVEEFTIPEIQHILALAAAMKTTQSFYDILRSLCARNFSGYTHSIVIER